jgi:hypothetical protein
MGNRALETCFICDVPAHMGCLKCNQWLCNDCAVEFKVHECPLHSMQSKPGVWKQWVVTYFMIGLECDTPIVEALRLIDLDRASACNQRDILNIAFLRQTVNKKLTKRDTSPKRKKEIHPVRELYFPGDISKGEPEKVSAVFEIHDDIKSMSIDLRPIGANNLPNVIKGDVDCPKECFVFSFLLIREVRDGGSEPHFGFPDQQKRYAEFRRVNIDLLKECIATKTIWKHKGNVLWHNGEGIYSPD